MSLMRASFPYLVVGKSLPIRTLQENKNSFVKTIRLYFRSRQCLPWNLQPFLAGAHVVRVQGFGPVSEVDCRQKERLPQLQR